MKWTIDALLVRLDGLEKLLDQRFRAQETALASALASQKEAITKAEVANEKRFDSVNEFRGQLKDQTSTFVSRPEMTSELRMVVEKIDSLTNRINMSEGKAEGALKFWGALVSGIATVGVVVGLWIIFKPQ
jgi:hypothetical protein